MLLHTLPVFHGCLITVHVPTVVTVEKKLFGLVVQCNENLVHYFTIQGAQNELNRYVHKYYTYTM